MDNKDWLLLQQTAPTVPWKAKIEGRTKKLWNIPKIWLDRHDDSRCGKRAGARFVLPDQVEVGCDNSIRVYSCDLAVFTANQMI